MSLILIDGFDGLAPANNAKWATVGSAGTARTGVRSMQIAGGTQALQTLLGASDEHATLIVGFAWRTNAWLSAGLRLPIMRFCSDSNGTIHGTLAIDNAGNLYVTRGTETGTTLGTAATGMVATGAWYHLEVKFVLSDTVGVWEVRVDGVSVISLSGLDTKNGGTKTVVDAVRFISTGAATVNFDDVYIANGAGVADNDIGFGDLKVYTYYPNGNGSTNQGVGSDGNSTDNYLLVDEPGDRNTTDYVEIATNDDLDLYAYQDITGDQATGSIRGVCVNTSAMRTGSTGKSFASVARSGGANYAGPDKALTTQYQHFGRLLDKNPNTGAAWTISEFNAAEFGWKARP